LFFFREIEREEFKKVMELMRDYNRQGKAQRNGLRTGLKVNRSVENSGLMQFFFGEDGNGKLKYDTFVEFLRGLHEEVQKIFNKVIMEVTHVIFTLFLSRFNIRYCNKLASKLFSSSDYSFFIL
jgi:hypothetical protein